MRRICSCTGHQICPAIDAQDIAQDMYSPVKICAAIGTQDMYSNRCTRYCARYVQPSQDMYTVQQQIHKICTGQSRYVLQCWMTKGMPICRSFPKYLFKCWREATRGGSSQRGMAVIRDTKIIASLLVSKYPLFSYSSIHRLVFQWQQTAQRCVALA